VTPFEFDLMGDTRYLRRCWCNCEDSQRERLIEQLDERDRQAGALIINAGLQAGKLAQFTFERWQVKRNRPWSERALPAAQDYVKSVEQGCANWMFLHGPYGVGKTHLATATLRQVAFERMWTPCYIVWPAHCSAVQQSWDNDNGAGKSEGQLWAQMRSADILLIDDIDKRDPTAWAVGKLYEVIDFRQLRERPTIITANRSVRQLEAYWSRSQRKGDAETIRDTSAAILSRIVGQLCVTVEFGGADQRWS